MGISDLSAINPKTGDIAMTQSFGSEISTPLTGLLDSAGLMIKPISPFEADSEKIKTLKAAILERKKHLIKRYKTDSPNSKRGPSDDELLELHLILMTDTLIKNCERSIQGIIEHMSKPTVEASHER